jgi:methionyl-tRNA formyltransferase
MRVLFIGGTKRGYLTLKALLAAGGNIVGIISLRQHEHEIERYEAPIKTLAGEHGVPIYETQGMKDRDYAELISKEIQPDIAFVVGCRVMIPREVYTTPPLGTLAVHDSLLPEYRGFAPLNWSILNGEDHTGVTLFYLNELMDGGDIVAQKRVPIGPDDTAPEVYERVCQATVDVILETYPLFAEGMVPRIKQDYGVGSFTCSRAPIDGMIDWQKPTPEIYNQVRALAYPYPGAFTFYKGKKLIVWEAKPLDVSLRYVGRIPGRVVNVSSAEGTVDVLTGDGILRIYGVQFEGGERMAAAEVISSVRGHLGLHPLELLDRIEALERQIRKLTGAYRE